MKYLVQTSSKESIKQSQSQSKELKSANNLLDQKNSENTKIQNDNKQNSSKMLNDLQRAPQLRKFEDILSLIGISEKQTQFKLFIQLGFKLYEEPRRILDIKPTMKFMSSFIEFTRKILEKQYEQQSNPIKAYEQFLNSLFFLIMLIISGGKDHYINQPLRKKLFNNESFLKHLLALEIYESKENKGISKIYGAIIKHVYSLQANRVIRKCLVQSILRNLRYFDEYNSKTALYIIIILNEQRFIHRLKQPQIRQYNLIQTTENIFHANKQLPQAAQALKYFMYLICEFPQLVSSGSTSNPLQKLYMTEKLKKHIVNDLEYHWNYLRYVEHIMGMISTEESADACQLYYGMFVEVSNCLQEKSRWKLVSMGWVEILLNIIQLYIKTEKNHNAFLWMIQNGLVTQLLKILSLETIQQKIEHLVVGLVKLSLQQAQLKFPQLYWGLLNFVYKEITLSQMKNLIPESLKKSFYTEISSKIENLSKTAIELE